MRTCTAALATLLLALGCAGGQAASAGGDETLVILSRHAERASDDPNADLSAEGLARAQILGELARSRDVTAIYTTDLCRTAQTGQPAALGAGASIFVLATGSGAAGLDACTPAIQVGVEPAGGVAAADVAARIRERHRGETVLLVGHSNTVPAMLEALTGASPCPDMIPLDERGRCFLPESAYGDVFIVHLPAAGPARVERTRAGA